MKTELRLQPHSATPGASVVEIWHDGQLMATIAGADIPAVAARRRFRRADLPPNRRT